MKQSELEEAHSKSKQSQNYFARRFSPDLTEWGIQLCLGNQ